MTHATIHTVTLRRLAIALVGAVVVFGFAGCQTPTSAENKEAAHDRWSLARAGVMYSMAKQQFEVGDLDKAEKTVRSALGTKPDEPRFLELAARIAIERGELEKAFHTLELANGYNADRPETHYLFGVVFQRWQKYPAAYDSYLKSYDLKSDEVSPLLAAAEMLVKMNRDKEAIDLLESKATYFEHNPALRVAVGRMHMLRRDFKIASRFYREAHLLAPDDPTILEHLASALYASDQPGEAIYYLVNLRQVPAYKDRSDVAMTLGDCYMATGKPNKARKVFMELTEADENNVAAWIKLGQAAWVVGDRIRAEESARRTMALAPERHEGYLLHGMIAMQRKRHDEAVKVFTHASALAPEQAAPLILKGMALERLGNTRAAVASYQQALRVDPNDQRARALLTAVAP